MKVKNGTLILLLGSVLVGFIFAYYVLRMTQCEHFSGSDANVKILSAQETADFLSKDEDYYVQGMTMYDLRARKVRSHTEYLNKISESAQDASQWEAKRLYEATSVVDAFLSTHVSSTVPSRLRDMPWKIAITKGKAYEAGYPHTRADVIFVSDTLISSGDLEKTLLHEKTHVFQRAFPQEMDSWLQKRGFKRWKTRTSEPLIRANPDLDSWIYIDPVSQRPMVATYNSETPSSISDVKLTNFSFEHPYEYMAYEVAEEYEKKKSPALS